MGVSGGGGPGHPGVGVEFGVPSGVLFEPVVVSAQAGEVVVGGGPGRVGDGVVEVGAGLPAAGEAEVFLT